MFFFQSGWTPVSCRRLGKIKDSKSDWSISWQGVACCFSAVSWWWTSIFGAKYPMSILVYYPLTPIAIQSFDPVLFGAPSQEFWSVLDGKKWVWRMHFHTRRWPWSCCSMQFGNTKLWISYGSHTNLPRITYGFSGSPLDRKFVSDFCFPLQRSNHSVLALWASAPWQPHWPRVEAGLAVVEL